MKRLTNWKTFAVVAGVNLLVVMNPIVSFACGLSNGGSITGG